MGITYADAVALDAADPLAAFGDAFLRHEDPVAYLDGNSLGRPPKSTLQRMTTMAHDEWGGWLIRGWQRDWMDLPERVGDRIAAACLDAAPGQTTVCDSTSVNLYKVLHAACGLRPRRDEVVADDANFPTDRYLLESVAAERGLRIRWLRPDPVTSVTAADLDAVLGPRTALVLLSHVDYRSGALLDLDALTAQVHDAGALAVWDLCHSVGVARVGLDGAGVDFAVGCTYKYLNAGPGAPAFCYVAERHLPAVRQPIPGWWGAADRFAMGPEYEPAPSISRMHTGTPNVIAVAAVDEGVRLVGEAGIDAIRAKAVTLTSMCVEYADACLAPLGFEVASPRDPERRGAHVSLRHDHAYETAAAMTEAGVVPDFRSPDIVRLGLSPLTTSHAELWTAMDAIRQIAAQTSTQ